MLSTMTHLFSTMITSNLESYIPIKKKMIHRTISTETLENILITYNIIE